MHKYTYKKNYKGCSILVLNMEGLNETEQIEAMNEYGDIVRKSNKDILTIVNIENTFTTISVKSKAKEIIESIRGLLND